MGAVEVATGWVDITPYHNGWSPQDRPYWHGGYGSANALVIQATGVGNSLFAKCLVLRQGRRACVLVTADILAITRPMDQVIRAAVQQLGVADADFAIVSSHTHSGPVLDERPDPFITYWLDGGLPEVNKYTTWLCDAIVELVRQTLQDAPATACNLDYGVGSAGFARNRFNDFTGLARLDMDAYLDHSVPVITARSVADGSVRAIVFGYACHAVSRGGDGSFDGDFPGEAATILENVMYPDGVLTFFLPGASGDNDPTGNRSPALVHELGNELAEAVHAVVEGNGKTPLDGTLRTDITRIELPLAVTDGLRDKYAQRFADHGDGDKVGRHAHRMLDPDNFSATATSITLPVQMWTFGPDAGIQLALCGGEVVSRYNHHFKTELKWGDRFWLTGHANQVPCYIVSDEMLEHGGYEPGWHPSEGPDIAWAEGSMLYQGWPCRLAGSADLADGNGVEQRVTNAITDLATAHRKP